MILDNGLIEDIEKITYSNYTKYKFNNDDEKTWIPDEDLISMYENLVCEYHVLEEKLEDVIQDRNDNYKQITPRQMYGDINDNFR
jgi:hypothetical protein